MVPRIDQVILNVVFHDLGHQTGQRTPHARDLVHERLASGVGLECTLDRFNLAADTARPRQKAITMFSRVHFAGIA